MSIEFWKTVSHVGFIVFWVMLVVTAILVWKLKIPAVWEELTGRKQRKEIEKLNEKPAAYVKRFSFPMEEIEGNNSTELLGKTEKLVDAQIQDDTKLLEEFSYIPVKQAEVEFKLVKDEASISDLSDLSNHQEENVTALLKQ